MLIMQIFGEKNHIAKFEYKLGKFVKVTKNRYCNQVTDPAGVVLVQTQALKKSRIPIHIQPPRKKTEHGSVPRENEKWVCIRLRFFLLQY